MNRLSRFGSPCDVAWPKSIRFGISLLLGVILQTGSWDSRASQRHVVGPYTIYATALSSMLIPAEVASVHNIVRGPNRMVVNVTILKDAHPVRAEVEGTATNLLSQPIELVFAEVTERDAIYYLATVITGEKDQLTFDIAVSTDAGLLTRFSFTRRY